MEPRNKVSDLYCHLPLCRAWATQTAAPRGGTPSAAPWTAVSLTAPETRTREPRSAHQPLLPCPASQPWTARGRPALWHLSVPIIRFSNVLKRSLLEGYLRFISIVCRQNVFRIFLELVLNQNSLCKTVIGWMPYTVYKSVRKLVQFVTCTSVVYCTHFFVLLSTCPLFLSFSKQHHAFQTTCSSVCGELSSPRSRARHVHSSHRLQ